MFDVCWGGQRQRQLTFFEEREDIRNENVQYKFQTKFYGKHPVEVPTRSFLLGVPQGSDFGPTFYIININVHQLVQQI